MVERKLLQGMWRARRIKLCNARINALSFISVGSRVSSALGI
jgi:hypothetical protein